MGLQSLTLTLILQTFKVSSAIRVHFFFAYLVPHEYYSVAEEIFVCVLPDTFLAWPPVMSSGSGVPSNFKELVYVNITVASEGLRGGHHVSSQHTFLRCGSVEIFFFSS